MKGNTNEVERNKSVVFSPPPTPNPRLYIKQSFYNCPTKKSNFQMKLKHENSSKYSSFE